MVTYQVSNIEMEDGGKYYVEGTCLSTDTKPTDVANGSKMIEMDTGKIYTFDADSASWIEFEGRMAKALESMAGFDRNKRISSLTQTRIAIGNVIEAIGIPEYVNDVSAYDEYGITEPGWYLFARIAAKGSMTVTANTTITGAAGYIADVGEDHVDVAVRFEVAAESQKVVIDWGCCAEIFVFKATDLAVRNLDYRVTFYVYDIDEFATWEFGPATDEKFSKSKIYFTLEDGEYVPAEVIPGDPVPADTYYVHTKVIFQGMTRNITYRCNTPVDCPSEFILPEIEDDVHGAWFEIRFRHLGAYSSTLITPADDIKVASEHTQAETEGMNMVDLHYTSVGGEKVWRFMNTHSTIPKPQLESIEFRTPPSKTVYTAGETLDLTGAAVIATFADGHVENVTSEGGCTFTPASGTALTTETTELVASYTANGVTKTATVALTVS